MVEVHFSLQEKGGGSVTRIGTTADGVTDVTIPDSFLENNGATQDYKVYAFVYVENGESGNTEYKIEMSVKARPKPEVPGTPEEPELFKEAIKTVNKAADRAETAEQNAKDSASKAEEAANSASASAKAAADAKTEALEEIGNKKQDVLSSIQTKKEESLSAIRTQEEKSVSKVTEHTNEEIQRFQNAANESKGALDRSIEEAGEKKTSLDSSIQTADSSKANLDESIQNAGSAKSGLDASTGKAKDAKTELDGSIQTAGEKQAALDTTVGKARELDTSLTKNIESGTQLQKDLVASGEKAVQNIQSAGTEQLDKMQTVADEFEADREQVNVNKENIASLTEDLVEVQDKKITKFYASNQGENHLADSDKGKIADMIIYGRSSQFTTTGKNLANGQNVNLYINGSTNICGASNNDAGMAIDVSKLTNVTISTRSIQDRYRAACVNTIPQYGRNETCYNGKNKDRTKDSYTIDTTGYNYLIINATKLEDIQAEKGSEATSYEPYTGGIPSPNPDYPQEIKSVVNPTIKVCGKNLFKVIQGGYISGNDGSIYPAKEIDIGATGFININNRDITVVGKKFNTSVLNAYAFRIGFYDAKKNWIKNIILTDDRPHNINSFKVTNAEYIRVSAPAGIYDTIQIEYGSEATSYEPYHEQTVQLPYTLNAIPVASGGNVTIDGQQYIADRVVEKDGVFGIERNIREIHTNTKTMNNSEEYPGWDKVEGITDVVYYNRESVGESRKATFISTLSNTFLAQNSKGTNNILYFIRHIIGYSQSELIAKAIDVDMYIRLQDAIFEPLPGDIQAKLRTLVTNYPVTNISVTSDQLDGYTVFNYPISMKNGWDYVKKQLNDNRDYIYDMDAKTQDIDTQSAEAYVNSEYAVALTELEVM